MQDTITREHNNLMDVSFFDFINEKLSKKQQFMINNMYFRYK